MANELKSTNPISMKMAKEVLKALGVCWPEWEKYTTKTYRVARRCVECGYQTTDMFSETLHIPMEVKP